MICWPPHVDSALFLERHWQKAPLLMPGGTTGLGFLPSPEELAGLACEDDVDGDLVDDEALDNFFAMLDNRKAIGFDFDALDGEPVDLVFALLVPEDANEEHLQLLAQLATRFDMNPQQFMDTIESPGS